MPFSLQAIVGSTTVTLSDGNPFSLRRATGMGGAGVRRVTVQGPAQDGDTDKGYRLAPREMELVIGFKASTDAALDTHRDTLMSIFKPLMATPVKLRATRDDGDVRQIDCFTRGTVDIRLNVEHRPGHYHEATIRLRAADPAWYDLASGTVTTTGTVNIANNWQLAGGAIGTAQVLDYGLAPSQGQVWTYTGTIPGTSTWTIAIRTAYVSPGTIVYPYYVENLGTGTNDIWWRAGIGSYEASAEFPDFPTWEWNIGTAWMVAGTQNYFHSYVPPNAQSTYYTQYLTRNTGPDGNATLADTLAPVPIMGTARRWRSDGVNTASTRWPVGIERYAVYSPMLNQDQHIALDSYMTNALGGDLTTSVTVPYAGDLPEYPVITIKGPVSNPAITNLTTGETLDFGTITIAGGVTYVVDTRYGHKSVFAGTVSKMGELTDDSDLATWHLAPHPLATGGTNIIALNGTATSAATEISFVYYNRYSSY